MDNISTLEEAAEVLEGLGYECVPQDSSVSVKIGGADNPFTAVVTLNADIGQMTLVCQLAKLGDIRDEDNSLTEFLMSALDANTRTRPYALAIISDTDNPELDNEADWPIVLTNSIPLGDLSQEELEAAMSSLLSAVMASEDLLRTSLAA